MHIVPADATGIDQALQVMKDGGIVAHATETCYGLACDLTNPQAVKQLFELKQRPIDMPVSALFSSVEHAKQFVTWTDRAQELADEHLPGPLTLILPANPLSPHILYVVPEEESDSIGVRISSHPVAQQLVEKIGTPISTTSANIHGADNCYSLHDLTSQFNNADITVINSDAIPAREPSIIMSLVEGEKIMRS